MKISSKNIFHLARATSNHVELDSLKLNLNFNELASEDIKNLCEAIQNAKLISLDLSFKGCGLPRNAFKRLCGWLQESVELSERLILDFTL
jgi:hypothetical protein